MKIYTRVVHEWDGEKYVITHAESFEYTGPIAYCGDGGASAAAASSAKAAETAAASAVGAEAAGGAALAAETAAASAVGAEAVGGALMPAAVVAPEVAGFVPMEAAGIAGSVYGPGVSGALMPPAVMAPEASKFVPQFPGSSTFVPPGETFLDKTGSMLKDVFGNPITKVAMQVGSELYRSDQMEKAQGAAATRAADQARSFNEQLSSLIRNANQSAAAGSSATAVPLGETVSSLYGSRGAVDPTAMAASMGRPAPSIGTSTPGGAVSGTPNAPAMPNSGPTGAVKLDSRPRMYA